MREGHHTGTTTKAIAIAIARWRLCFLNNSLKSQYPEERVRVPQPCSLMEDHSGDQASNTDRPSAGKLKTEQHSLYALKEFGYCLKIYLDEKRKRKRRKKFTLQSLQHFSVKKLRSICMINRDSPFFLQGWR